MATPACDPPHSAASASPKAAPWAINPSGSCSRCLMLKHLTFEQWQSEVNQLVFNSFGLTADDFIDWPSRRCYDEHKSPKEGYIEFLRWQE